MQPILLIDAFNFFARHFIVNPASTARGVPIGGVIGTLKGIANLAVTLKPKAIVVVWEDGGGSQRRRGIFKEYKEGRKGLRTSSGEGDEVRIYQLQVLSKALGCLPVCQIYASGAECDDVISYLVQHKFQGEQVIIASNDKDFYQLLVDSRITIYDPATKNLYNSSRSIEKFGVPSHNLTLARAVVGDPSDNLDGVPGVGFVTLLKSFPELATNEEFLPGSFMELAKAKMANHISQPGPATTKSKKAPPKALEAIIASQEIIERNWRLMLLDISALTSEQIAKVNTGLTNYSPEIEGFLFMKILLDSEIPYDTTLQELPKALSYLTKTSNCINQKESSEE
jgi:DNA polymerase-1